MRRRKIRRVIGIDASLSSTGVCIMDRNTKNILYAFKICPFKDLPNIEKIHLIANKISSIAYLADVDFAIIEDQHFGSNASVYHNLSMLSGAIQCKLMDVGIMTLSKQPCEIRRLLGIDSGGSADKEEVYKYVVNLYKHNHIIEKLGKFNDKNGFEKNSDIFDAISMAIALINFLDERVRKIPKRSRCCSIIQK